LAIPKKGTLPHSLMNICLTRALDVANMH